NACSAKQLAHILAKMSKTESFSAFERSLPVAGRSGTLASIGGGSAAEGRVRAKSGTLDRVKNYAGYVSARSGKRYAFALMINQELCTTSTLKAKIVRVWNRMVAL
ncbi:MAG: D-alanyl-D-alanine carboxypeptidase, partial [Verrucomicrobiota bacterium]